MKKRKNKIEVNMPMKFNPATMGYESDLPLKRTGKKLNVKIDWKLIITILLVLILIGLFFIALKTYSS